MGDLHALGYAFGSISPLRVAPTGAAMQQIADWLKQLGLGRYTQRFAENDIVSPSSLN